VSLSAGARFEAQAHVLSSLEEYLTMLCQNKATGVAVKQRNLQVLLKRTDLRLMED
jgi:hypothetical protein